MDQKKFVKMWVEENHNCYDMFPSMMNYGPKMAWGIPAKDVVEYAKDFHTVLYLNENEFEYFAQKGYEFYVAEDGLAQLTTRLENNVPAINSSMRRLVSLDLKNLDNRLLFQEYLDYVEPYGAFMRSYIVTQPHFMSKIEKELREKLSAFPDPQELFTVLTGASVEFEFSKKSGIFRKSFAELTKPEDAVIDAAILDEPFYEEKPLDGTRRKDMIGKYRLPEDVVRLGKILAGISETRMKMRFIWMPAVYYFELFIIELKRRYGISKESIRKYEVDELDELIRAGQIVDEPIIKERMKGFAKILSNGEMKTLAGKEANDFIKTINAANDEVKELKGMVASRGVASGKIVILSYAKSGEHTEKINTMEEGDILVSEMTRPNIITACKKAGAIITDEGGITCHAAIVSRELKKPCIIGTRIATQVLKDGDMVEVDADNGIVKIINK